MFRPMENVESIDFNYIGNDSKTQQKRMRKTKYSREPLFSKMMEAIRKVRESSRSVKAVAEESGFPCRTLRRYVELSMDDTVTSPFYFPLACDEAPIGRKFRQKLKNRAKQREAQSQVPVQATNDKNAATSALRVVEPLSEITSIKQNSRLPSPMHGSLQEFSGETSAIVPEAEDVDFSLAFGNHILTEGDDLSLNTLQQHTELSPSRFAVGFAAAESPPISPLLPETLQREALPLGEYFFDDRDTKPKQVVHALDADRNAGLADDWNLSNWFEISTLLDDVVDETLGS